MNLRNALDFCLARPDEQVKVRFPARAGALVRSSFRKKIESACSFNDVTVEVFESKGLFESTFSFILRGTGRNVAKAISEFLGEIQ